jgi:Flp pilus assembly protein TadD
MGAAGPKPARESGVRTFERGGRLRLLFLSALAGASLTGAAILAFPAANLLFVAGVFAHAALGIALLPLALAVWKRLDRTQPLQRLFYLLLLIGAAFGCFLIARGNTHAHLLERWMHVGFSGAALIVLLWWAGEQRKRGRNSNPIGAGGPDTIAAHAGGSGLLLPRWVIAAAACALAVPAVAAVWWRMRPDSAGVIANPEGFTSMAEETGGRGPFFPSSAHTISPGGTRDAFLPERFFEDSKACARCHGDIYREWKSSMHHMSSFNNQFYRRAIEYMQSVQHTTQPSQWCAACHDSAVLFTGKWQTPIKYQIHTPAAQAGLGCLSCHAIVHVKDTIGNNGFTIEDPPLHDLVESTNPFIRLAHDTALYLEPAPHDRTFLKAFHTQQTAEFCSVCHKVHLDVPVNHYRWSRGFDEYDNWQGSGVSGEGARSFYYPPSPLQCANCHMPLVRSSDPAAQDGFIHSHRFPAANTAVPYVDGDHRQLEMTEAFLRGVVSTDIFAITRTPATSPTEPGRPRPRQPGDNVPTEQTMFAQGEESGSFGATAQIERGPAQPVMAPLDQARPALHPGDSVRVDVVERTLRLGHFFPGGTIDAFDVWVAFRALDGEGHPFYVSGDVRPDGEIDPGAHFYRSLLVDLHGNPINKRNAWAAHSTIYVHLIPPGAADTVRFRITIPRNIRGPVTLEARLCYRKFSYFYTHFAYAGVSHDVRTSIGQPDVTLDYDDRPMTFDGPTGDDSGGMKRIPTLPIVVISESRVTLPVAGQATTAPSSGLPEVLSAEPVWMRWNDYGIGLLLNGDLSGAEVAFRRVTELNPKYADGFLNVGRVLVQEGETDAALPWITHALALNGAMARAHFFKALVLKADGNYDGALAELKTTVAAFPRDRVVLNQIGRIYFLKRQYEDAMQWLLRSTAVDPENIEAHYDLMLCYRGQGDLALARREEAMYERFKADESANAIAGAYLRAHPDDNNERQPIHEHYNDALGLQLLGAAAAAPRSPAVARRAAPRRRSRIELLATRRCADDSARLK